MSSLANKVLTSSFRAELGRIVDAHNDKVYSKQKVVVRDCSRKTREDRKNEIFRAFADLRQMGFPLQSPLNFKNRHLQELTSFWQAKKLSPRTINTRFSIITVFCTWIGKPNLPGKIEDYFAHPETIKRTSICRINKAWEANGVSIAAEIQEAIKLDERFGLLLALQHHFGLRVRESIEMRPLSAISETRIGAHLLVLEGTKGGRPRVVPILTAEQQQTLEWALSVTQKSRSMRLRWPGNTWKQAQRRFYHLMQKMGVTKADKGVTAHGLRHGYAQISYRKASGFPSPIEGGAQGKIDPATHRWASSYVSQLLGHIRPDVFPTYGGGYGHSLRVHKITVTNALFQNPLTTKMPIY
ncbi:MAG: integrase domain-containing protein [Gammaproteobacteria bacterium]|nr:integrase domain-containing protein [Gammaproteobacteria bacterium]MBU1978856.1 integrase domain-containing protein [Gammaproteobacteria bacterium]